MNQPERITESSEPPVETSATSTGTHAENVDSAADAQLGCLSDDRHPVDVLADEFSNRCRLGEMPSIDEYEKRAPEHRALIRSLFPTIAKIERMTYQEHFRRKTVPRILDDQKVIGDFRIVREIGRGGMGIVYEAIQRSLGRRVALKVLGSGIANSPHQLERFRREAESAARLHHTNIVPVYGIGEENGVHFYAMQYIDGVSLAAAIKAARLHSSSKGDGGYASTIASGVVSTVTSNVASHYRELLAIKNDNQEIQRTPESCINDPTITMSVHVHPDEISPNSSMADSSIDRPDIQSESLPTSTSSRRLSEHVLSIDRPESPMADKSPAGSMQAPTGLFAETGKPEYFFRVAMMAAQVADGLDYAHRHGVLHRDIKPSNLMLDQSGLVWIMDFGLVKVLEQQDLTQAGEIVGTLRYMAPEQIQGKAGVTTDVYALGLTLFELLTLKPAFDANQAMTFAQRVQESAIPRPRSINPAIPRDLETIVLKATSHEPATRYETAADLAEDLRRFCEDRPILARRTTMSERLWRWSRRNPALAAATGSTVFLLVLITALAMASKIQVDSALLDAKTAQKRTEANLFSAIDAFDSILDNVTLRGLPRSLAYDIPEADVGLTQTPLSAADALLLDRLLEFYRSFANDNAENVELRERIADAHKRAGAILVRLGRLDEAEADFRTAIALLAKILQSDPNDIDVVVETAALNNEIGELSLRRGEFQKTFRAHLEARAILLEQPPSVKADPSIRFELARATDLFASIDIRSGSDSAPGAPPSRAGDHGPRSDGNNPPGRRHPRDVFGKNGKFGPPGTRQEPGAPGRGGGPPGPPQDELGERLEKALPFTFASGGRIHDELANVLREASDEFHSLAREFPDKAEYQFRLAQCLRHRLVHAASTGNPVVARETFLEAKQILDELAAKFPNEPKYLFELADTLTQASRAESNNDAKESLDRSVSLSKQLFERFPAASEYQLLYGTALARRAANQAARGSTNDAESSLMESISTLKPLADQFPDQGVIQIPLAKTCQQLGDLLRSTSVGDVADVERLERSRLELQTAINRFEGYLSAPDATSKAPRKGAFNAQTCSDLYSSLADTLTQLQLPEQAAQARKKAAWRERPPR